MEMQDNSMFKVFVVEILVYFKGIIVMIVRICY